MSKPKQENSEKLELSDWLHNFRAVVIAGIGNPIRKDDFVGVRLVEKIKNRVPQSVHLIECETVPESHIDEIAKLKPSHIMLIDAAILGLRPGDFRLTRCGELTEVQTVSTHVLPLRIFCQHLAQLTDAKIALLLIQPKDTGFGEGLSSELEESTKRIARTILSALNRQIQTDEPY